MVLSLHNGTPYIGATPIICDFGEGDSMIIALESCQLVSTIDNRYFLPASAQVQSIYDNRRFTIVCLITTS